MSKLSDLKKKTLKNYEPQASQLAVQNNQATNVTIPPGEDKNRQKDAEDLHRQ